MTKVSITPTYQPSLLNFNDKSRLPILIEPSKSTRIALFALRLSVILLVLSLIAWMAAVGRTSDQLFLMGLGVAGTVLLSFPILLRKDYEPFEPLTAVFFLFLFGAPLKLCYIATYGQSSPYITERLMNWQPMAAMIPGVAIAVSGIACFVIAYSIPVNGQRFQRFFLPYLSQVSGFRLQCICVLLFCISFTALLAFIISAGVNLSSISAKRFSDEAGANAARVFDVNYYLYRLAAFSKFPAYLSVSYLLSTRKSFVSLLGFIFFASVLQTVLLSVIMSSRAGVVLLMIDLLLIGYFLKKSISLTTLLFIAVTTISLVLVVLQLRSQSRSPSEVIETGIAGRDMMDITKTAHIIAAVPDRMNYRYGEMIYGWLAAPIPRSWWHNKPMWIERGPFIMQHVYRSDNEVAGIPPGYIAELYWNFGLAGVLIGMLVFGFLVKTISEAFNPLRTNMVSVIIYAFIVTRFILFTLGNDLGTGIVKLGLDLVPLCFLLVLVQQPRHIRSVSDSHVLA